MGSDGDLLCPFFLPLPLPLLPGSPPWLSGVYGFTVPTFEPSWLLKLEMNWLICESLTSSLGRDVETASPSEFAIDVISPSVRLFPSDSSGIRNPAARRLASA